MDKVMGMVKNIKVKYLLVDYLYIIIYFFKEGFNEIRYLKRH